MPDSDGGLLIHFGSEVKSLGPGGRVGGHLILWGSADATDATGDYFTPETDLGRHYKSGLDLYYAHGLPRFGGQPIKPGRSRSPGIPAMRRAQKTLASIWRQAQLEDEP